MQPSTIATHLYVEDHASLASPSSATTMSPDRHWGDRALLAAERRLLPPRARPMSRAAARGQGGLWFRTAAVFMVSLSAGLLGLNAFLLFNAPKSEAANIALDGGGVAAVATLPAPVAPAQGYVANAAGVGRVIIAEPLPVATLTTDAYVMTGNRVQAVSPRTSGAPASPMSSGAASDGRLAPLSSPVPVNVSTTADPVSVAESQRNADEAMRVIAASTPSVHRTRTPDPALVDGEVAPPAEQTRDASGVWYGDGGVQ